MSVIPISVSSLLGDLGQVSSCLPTLPIFCCIHLAYLNSRLSGGRDYLLLYLNSRKNGLGVNGSFYHLNGSNQAGSAHNTEQNE